MREQWRSARHRPQGIRSLGLDRGSAWVGVGLLRRLMGELLAPTF